jgi:hypothetical protein
MRPPWPVPGTGPTIQPSQPPEHKQKDLGTIFSAKLQLHTAYESVPPALILVKCVLLPWAPVEVYVDLVVTVFVHVGADDAPPAAAVRTVESEWRVIQKLILWNKLFIIQLNEKASTISLILETHFLSCRFRKRFLAL